jgi:protein-tyrosine phosphatase
MRFVGRRLTTPAWSALESGAMTKLLMVCMGNICRSPMAQAVLQKMTIEARLTPFLEIDSAGTHAHHQGARTDPRAQAVLLRHGYDASRIRSRRITSQDFQDFDLILAMDTSNLIAIQQICPPRELHKLSLFLTQAETLADTEVPDPYYGSLAGFERVLTLCEAGAKGLIRHYLR